MDLRQSRQAWNQRVRYLVAMASLLGLVGANSRGAEPSVTPRIDFVQQIQPIFQQRCLGCHGPQKQEASYRLDHHATALRGGDSAEPAIVPGQSQSSRLIARVTSDDPQHRMPPEGEPLTQEQVDSLRLWIDQGADWPASASVMLRDPRDHWAFRPPSQPPLPTVARSDWPQNPIDHFVLAAMEQHQLQPAPPADRVALLRRLYLDLLGLPPSPAQVEAWLANDATDAYETLVDQILDSPHYGERWGRHWLDAARYADSDGFEKDKLRIVWPYRDWVIRAINQDLPYDQFILEQIAGDLLPQPTQDQRVATGFLRNSMINEEGGVDPEQFRMEAMFDRMDAIGKSILGLTIQCAQCHGHKYDPLSQSEYYQMFAFLNNCHEANMVVYSSAEQQQRHDLLAQIEQLEATLQREQPAWRAEMATWEASVRNQMIPWSVIHPEQDLTGDQKHYVQADGSILAAGYAPTYFTSEFKGASDGTDLRAVRLELLCDAELPLNGPGRSWQGLCALTEFKVFARAQGTSAEWEEYKIAAVSADVSPPERELDKIFDDKSGRRRVTGPPSFAIDGKDETAWGIDVGPGRRNVPRHAVFRLERPIAFPAGAELKFHLVQNHGGWNSDDNQNHNLGKFRFSVTSHADAEADRVPSPIRALLAVPDDQRTAQQVQLIFQHWRTTVPAWQAINEQIEKLWQQHPVGSSQLVLQERAVPRSTHLLQRGDFLKPQGEVAASVPEFLHPFPAGAPHNRLGFAQWLVDRNAPTTARALVNRVWQSYFGTGLVATSEDLGMQGERPSHPELLDWLAVEFMERGWSLKALHRLIVTSATYQQSAVVVPAHFELDPTNRWLSRSPRLRVEGEVVRDVALAASGLLDRTVGGASVFPPQPAFMMQPPVSYGPKVWPEEQGPNRYRRALYTFRYRAVPYPVLQTFDAPNGDFSCVRRTRSNTPLQALTALNEPIFMECAQHLARRAITEGGNDDRQRLEFAFRACVARQPTSAESSELLQLLRDQQQYIAQGWVNAWEIATGQTHPTAVVPASATPTEWAAWTCVARVLLNLDETITRP